MIPIIRIGGALLMIAMAARPLTAQGAPGAAPPRAQVVAAAREIMKGARYCTLVSIGLDGQPQARVVDAFAPDSGLTVWIATNAVTRKVGEIRHDPRVTLLYFNPTTFEYVTVIGRATLVDDAVQKAAHWKPEWSKLYKDENRGTDYLLIRVIPSRLEVVSVARGINNDPVTWRPTIVEWP